MTVDELYRDICNEIEDLHVFFVDWFSGNVAQDTLEKHCLSHLGDDLIYIHPSGNILTKNDLAQGLLKSHGSNKDVRIKVRDVNIRQAMRDQILVTYSEWQTGSTASKTGDHARFTTALITRQKPFRWLHLHETTMSEVAHSDGRANGAFDF